MKTYQGIRIAGEAMASVREGDLVRQLDPRYDLANHSPDGFEWGYNGSGPAQLALAICADALGSDDLAVRLYQHFKNIVVCGWKRGDNEGFSVRADFVHDFAAFYCWRFALYPSSGESTWAIRLEPECGKCGDQHWPGRCPAKSGHVDG